MATSATPSSPPHVLSATDDPIPMRHDPERMARLRAAFAEAGFTFVETFARWEARRARGESTNEFAADDPLDVLCALFLAERRVAAERMERVLPAQMREDLDALGLLRVPAGAPQERVGRVALSPVMGLWLAADNGYLDPGEGVRSDVVFDALTTNTQKFLTMLPLDPCDAFLELCSGTAVAALSAARRGARHAWGVDITARSTRFAEWNRAFNEVPNATMLRGDLYEPVADLTFDRIVAHPPYVPNVKQEMIYRDGGADGEQITRRVIAGLPKHLRPGGQFFCVCLATDRDDRPLEHRLRDWLGEAQGEFDVLLTELAPPRDPTAFFAYGAYKKGSGFGDLDERHRLFREMKVKRLVYAAILIQRRDRDRAVFTSRREAADGTASEHLRWALAFDTMASDPAAVEALVDAPLVLAEGVDLVERRRNAGGRLTCVDVNVDTENPFVLSAACPPWAATFLGGFLTPATPRERAAAGAAAGALPPELATDGPLRSVTYSFAAAGVLHAPDRPPPPPRRPGQGLW